MDNNSIKDAIYRFRKAKGYTQVDMAARIGTSVTTYRSIESGKTQLIHPMVQKIAEVLEISEESLLSGAEESAHSDSLEEDGAPYLARKPDADLEKKTIENYELRLDVDRAEIDSLKEMVRNQQTVIIDMSRTLQMARKLKRLDETD